MVKVKVKSLSPVRLLATPWTAAYQASPSMEFSRQEYWSGLPLPSPFSQLFPGIIQGYQIITQCQKTTSVSKINLTIIPCTIFMRCFCYFSEKARIWLRDMLTEMVLWSSPHGNIQSPRTGMVEGNISFVKHNLESGAYFLHRKKEKKNL